MVWFDARPVRRLAQIVLDVIVAGGIIAAIMLGRAVSTSIGGLARIGQRVHEQGTTFEEQLRKAATAIGTIPFAGKAASAPLRNAGKSAGSIAAAGSRQHDETIRLAHQVGVGVAVIVIVLLVAVWIRYRGGFIRRATATRRLDRRPGGTDILALRALVQRDSATALGADVVERWKRGDEPTVTALADLERRSSGLRGRSAASAPHQR